MVHRAVRILAAVLLANTAVAQHPLVLRPVMEFGTGGGQVWSVAFSPDGRLLASGGHHGDVVLWDVASRRIVRRFVAVGEHGERGRLVDRIWPVPRAPEFDGIDALAFSPDGKWLAFIKASFAFSEHRVFVLELASGRLLQRRAGSASALAFDRVGRLAYFDRRHVVILDPARDAEVARIKTLTAARLAFAGGDLLVARPNGFVERFSVPAGRCLATHIALGRLTAFARQGRGWLAGYRDGHLWDGARRRQGPADCQDLAVSRDGRTIAVAGGATAGVALLNAELELRQRVADGQRALAVAFGAGGELAVATAAGGVQLWQGSRRVAVLLGHHDAARSLAFSPDGNHLGVNTVGAFVVDLRQRASGPRRPAPGLWIAGTAGAELIWVGREELSVWHAGGRRVAFRRGLALGAVPIEAALSPDRNRLAFRTGSESATLLDLRTAARVQLPGERRGFHWHPAGRRLAAARVRERGDCRPEILDRQGAVSWDGSDLPAECPWRGRFSPNGQRFVAYNVSESAEHGIRVCLFAAPPRRPLAMSEHRLRWWRFLSEERAISHDGRAFRIWSLPDLRSTQVLEVSGAYRIDGAALSLNRKRLAVDCRGHVRVFDLQ